MAGRVCLGNSFEFREFRSFLQFLSIPSAIGVITEHRLSATQRAILINFLIHQRFYSWFYLLLSYDASPAPIKLQAVHNLAPISSPILLLSCIGSLIRSTTAGWYATDPSESLRRYRDRFHDADLQIYRSDQIRSDWARGAARRCNSP